MKLKNLPFGRAAEIARTGAGANQNSSCWRRKRFGLLCAFVGKPNLGTKAGQSAFSCSESSSPMNTMNTDLYSLPAAHASLRPIHSVNPTLNPPPTRTPLRGIATKSMCAGAS